MTTESCIAFCDAKSFVYAGTEYSVRDPRFFMEGSSLRFINPTGICRPNAVRYSPPIPTYPCLTFEWIDCDNNLHGGVLATAADCNMPCSGNTLETCGAGGRLSLYWSGKTPPPPPATAPTIGKWNSLGCYRFVCPHCSSSAPGLLTNCSDNVNGAGRTLGVGMPVTGDMTQAKCTTACFNAGFPLSGAEYAA